MSRRYEIKKGRDPTESDFQFLLSEGSVFFESAAIMYIKIRRRDELVLVVEVLNGTVRNR